MGNITFDFSSTKKGFFARWFGTQSEDEKNKEQKERDEGRERELIALPLSHE